MSCDFIFVHDAKFLIKYIFTFHILKNNYFFFHPIAITHPIPIRFLLHLKCDGDGSQPLTRTDGLPTHTRLSHCQAHCHPSARRSLHQLHHMADPLVPILNSLPDSIPHQGVSHHDSRLWRSLTGIITRNTSNYTRNTYI